MTEGKSPALFVTTIYSCTKNGLFLLLIGAILFSQALTSYSAQPTAPSSSSPPAPQEPEINFLLRDQFFFSPDLKLKFNTYETDGFLFLKESRSDLNSEYSIITGFDNNLLETQALKDVKTVEEAKALIKRSAKLTTYMDVSIKTLSLPLPDGAVSEQFWVGQKSFPSMEKAKASIVAMKTAIETNGGNFDRALALIDEFAPAEPKEKTPEEIKADFKREEDFAIKVMDWLDVGEKLYGPFHARLSPYGEPILWQSFGETSFRFSNLEKDEYYSQVFYWTNRLVLKGIWGPWGTTFDPFVEATPALESNGIDYKSNLQLTAGIEWYPLIRSAALQNFRLGGIPLSNFIRNYRIFAQYMLRENLKNEITGSKSHDFRTGIDIFYEWGLDLELLGQKPYKRRFIDYVHDYVWGEYFGTYHYEHTNFSGIRAYDSFLMNSSLILGLDWPSIPLPANPVNDHLYVMPYMRFEHVSNANHPLHYQNQYFVAAGVRMMPFRSFQFSNNEWLFKTKLFFEYVGVGGIAWPSANTPPDTPDRDLRFGVAFSYKRF